MVHRLKLGPDGRIWRLSRESKKPHKTKSWGWANFTARELYLDPSLSGRRLALYALHEGLHVEVPDLDEEAIKRIARNLLKVLRAVEVL